MTTIVSESEAEPDGPVQVMEKVTVERSGPTETPGEDLDFAPRVLKLVPVQKVASVEVQVRADRSLVKTGLGLAWRSTVGAGMLLVQSGGLVAPLRQPPPSSSVHSGGLVAPLAQSSSPPPPSVHSGGLVAPFKQSPLPARVQSGGLVAPLAQVPDLPSEQEASVPPFPPSQVQV